MKFNKLIENSVRKFARLSRVLVIGLAVGAGESSFASNCDGYLVATSGSSCGCTDSTSGGSMYNFGDWTEQTGTASPYGTPASNTQTSTDVCADSVTTTCSSTTTAASIGAMTTGRILYVRNVSSGATDYFKCTWQASGGFGTSSAYTPTPLSSAPTTLTATVASATQINLAWADTSSDETGFKIESPVGTVITTTSQNATTYSHTGLTCGTTYNYAVKATNINNADSAPATASATTSACSAGGSSQTIAFNALPNKTVGDAPFPLSATASSGLSVNYIATGNCEIWWPGPRVNLTGVGSCTITASQAGNGSYSAAADVSQVFSISVGAVSVPIFSLKDKPVIFFEELK